jgi:hypothetical protein
MQKGKRMTVIIKKVRESLKLGRGYCVMMGVPKRAFNSGRWVIIFSFLFGDR